MLVSNENLLNVPILSLQASGEIARTSTPIIDPDDLKIIAFYLQGPLVAKATENILDAKSVREYSKYGMVIDSADELVGPDDVIKIQNVLQVKFNLIGLKVESKKGTRIGKVVGFNCTDNDFMIQQLIVQRGAVRALLDPDLLIPRSEIVEVSDDKIIVKDELKKIIENAATKDFVPNYVNPFRKNPEPDYAPAQNQNPDEQDS